ncbi:MAG: hypothetical protein H6Q06_149 [Acidobacteria bacterium]|nr:hypothetical protein [Acidobacteriota bacterium]
MSDRTHFISIWFFIGAMLLTYGVLIFGAGIYELYSPPAQPVVLAKLHAGIWWGALLSLLGALYIHRFRPKHGPSVKPDRR